FYSHLTSSRADHVVDQNLDLAAEAGATSRVITFPLPEGREEPGLPEGPFVLASPLAGWGGKQWPLAHFHTLARLLRRDPGVNLVLAGPPQEQYRLGPDYYACTPAGLIHATRRASAVVGLDSGPLHVAAALGRPGVAIYGPTDPKRNGPYGDTFTVLRAPGAATTYRRGAEPAESMRQVSAEQVHEALQARITRSAMPARRSA
ncbi:MAG: glycosyltransferase family 9 protein, partial [Bryobacteraceae bacterium]